MMDFILKYLEIGFNHVIPFGLDHILFILSLFLLNSKVKSVLIQCSIFTLAHSITIGLCAGGYFLPNANFIEPLISISILITSLENIFHSKLYPWRLVLVFLFGLIHGMGFANALLEIGLPSNKFLSAILLFNVGVELGQIVVLLLAYYLLSKWFRERSWYREWVVYPLSSIIACIAIYWTIQRVLG